MLGRCPGDPRTACRRSPLTSRPSRPHPSARQILESPCPSSTVDPADPVFRLHRGGKMAVASTVPLTSREDLSLAYTPGVARVCEAIAADPALVDDYTWVVAHRRGGHRRLGRARPGQHRPARRDAGDGGQGGAVQAVRRRGRGADLPGHPGRGRDRRGGARRWRRRSAGSTWRTSAPRAASRSSAGSTRRCDIPVFHDDQHGTAIVVLAALRNAATLLDRKLGDLRVVVSGAGAAGVAVTKMLIAGGVDPGDGGRLRLARASSTPDRTDLDRRQGRAGGADQRRPARPAASPRRCAARTC